MARRARLGDGALNGRPPARGRPRRALRAGALAAALAALLAAGAPPVGAGAPSWTHAEELNLNVERRAAVRRGCEWIAAQAHPDDDGRIGDKAVVATTALSALAFMAEGTTISRGPHYVKLRRAIKFLVELAERPAANGFPAGFVRLDNDRNSKMHGQGYATLALASALGSVPDDDDLPRRIRRALEKSVLVCEQSQTQTGGWGYEPDRSTDHEGSVTVTIAQGLRAARDAGVMVRDPVVRAGIRYLEKSQKKEDGEDDGSFKYSLTVERSSYALTAAALSSFFLFGEYGSTSDRRDRIDRAIGYMKRRLSDVLRVPSDESFFYYGNFYAAWAAWQKDGDAPEPSPRKDGRGYEDWNSLERTSQLWGPWHSRVYPRLLSLQARDGHWSEMETDRQRMDLGDLVPTTFAVLTLAMPDELIPVFQR